MSAQTTETPTPAANQTPTQTPSSNTGTPAPAAPASTGTPAAAATPADNFMSDEPVETPAPAEPFAGDTGVEANEYTLELEEDSLVPDEDFDALVAEAQAKGLSKDEAQARLSLLDKAFGKAKNTYISNEGKRLIEDLVKDPYFDTKEKQKQAKEDIARVYENYKDPELVKEMKSNPLLGNNKHIVKLLATLGASMRPVTSAPQGQGAPASATEEKTGLEKAYPEFFKDPK